MWELLQLALRGGFKTSEFWLAALSLVVTVTAPLADEWVAHLRGIADTQTGTVALVATIGAAVISAAYSLARAHTKSSALKAGASTMPAPSGNVVTPGPGTAALEEAHRAAVVDATAALKMATEALTKASNLPRPATYADSLTVPRGAVNDLPAPSSPAAAAPPKANG